MLSTMQLCVRHLPWVYSSLNSKVTCIIVSQPFPYNNLCDNHMSHIHIYNHIRDNLPNLIAWDQHIDANLSCGSAGIYNIPILRP
jgi:hypothetical protein